MFGTIFQNGSITGITEIGKILICMGVAFVLGLIVAFCYMKTEKNYSKPYVVSLVILPTAVCALISAVNGNIGTGIAVAGTFALVRFRSQQGTAKEIAVVYVAMAIGLLAATGYIFFTVMVALILCIVLVILFVTGFGAKVEKTHIIKISSEELLDFPVTYPEVFEKYAENVQWISSKNKNGSCDSKYRVTMKKDADVFGFIKALSALGEAKNVAVYHEESNKEL